MYWNFSEIAEIFSQKKESGLLLYARWGLEKESLRVTRTGDLALTPHPPVFGDKIENPYIQTDFSESQLELITPPCNTIEQTYDFLYNLHVQVERAIGDELMWPLSMPGQLPEDDRIPTATYNASLRGEIKEIYRSGLSLRYGKKMQMISGIHFNFSLRPELWSFLYDTFSSAPGKDSFINEMYIALVRNYLRYQWLLLYLFGASPVADESYWGDSGNRTGIVDVNPAEMTDRAKEITSLRMSRFGYRSPLQKKISVSYNSLEEYIRDLRTAVSTTSPIYKRIGTYKGGRRIQLNDHLLQSDNEYYAPARLKQIVSDGESQLDALEKKGIHHVELRIFDLNPFEKTGISLEQMRFIQVFILFCLFEKSDPIFLPEADIIEYNAEMTALAGKRDGLLLMYPAGGLVPLRVKGEAIIQKLRIIAELLDMNSGDGRYARTVEAYRRQLHDATALPSTRILKEMRDNNERYREFGLRKAKEHLEQAGPGGGPSITSSADCCGDMTFSGEENV